MEKTIVSTGKTIDLAIEAALNQLGLDRDSVSVMVLQQAKTGFLGFGAQPAKVQLTYEVPDPLVEKATEKPKSALGSASRSKPKATAIPGVTPEPPKPEAPKPPKAEAPKPPRQDKPKAPRPEKKAEAPKTPREPKPLLPLAALVTPNIPEAQILAEQEIKNETDMLAAAKTIGNCYGCAVLLKGGHSVSDANDLLYVNGEHRWFYGKRINNPNTHGTGCTLSSAIAANLAKGYALEDAVERAKAYISGALAAMLDLGRGSGPMNHAFDLHSEFRK